jgi:hypothetical protein
MCAQGGGFMNGFTRSGTTGLALLMMSALLQTGAAAGGERFKPPSAVLKNNLGRQEGAGPSFSYGRHEGKFCIDTISDGSADWPKPLEHKRHRKLHIRFRKDRKPSELTIDEDHGRGVAYKLKPILNGKGETVGWDARFRRPELGHHRLWVDVLWQGNHECQYDQATYMFHVKTID